MVVTNVPGPQVPIYLLGARMLESYPHVPLADRLGLGIALLSYDGRIHWGFSADYDVVPDLADFVDDVSASFRALRQMAAPIALRGAEPRGVQPRSVEPRAAEASPAPVRRPAAARKRRNGSADPTASAG
jgi:hypothetical protein